MSARRLFLAALAGFLVLYGGYGQHRFSAGLDLTDEGAHLAWPSLLRWGEKPFTSEITTLTRPVEVYLGVIFRLRPATTLYEFRLLGWSLHLAAFAVLAGYLFRLTAAPLQSLLLASIPFFACHVFGNASPYYNTLSSDFLLLALCAKGLAGDSSRRQALAWETAGGIALFVAALSHPALSLVAALLLLRELVTGGLPGKLLRRQLTPANLGMLAFLACGLLFVGGMAASGALAVWWERIGLAHGAVTAFRGSTAAFLLNLLIFPLALNRLALTWAVAGMATLILLQILHRRRRDLAATYAAGLLGMVLVASLIATATYAPEWLPLRLAFVGMIVVAATALGLPGIAAEDLVPARRLMMLSGLAALIYASFTYYFSPVRSWTSGILGLPFALATGLALMFQSAARLRVATNAMLLLAVACLAVDHHQSIWRDAGWPSLQATSHIPRLRNIRSTPERMQALDALHDYFQDRLAPGESLLVYDACPLLYFLLDARPAYGLTWATRFGIAPEVLAQLHRELLARPLPRYAIRIMVDLDRPVWATAPTVDYRDYPLNETVETNYGLERTIFPFEIWRLKTTPAL